MSTKLSRNWQHLLWIIPVVLIYFDALKHPFTHLDDYEQVVSNPLVNSGLWTDFAPILQSFAVGMFQPLTTAIFKLIYNLSNGETVWFHSIGFVFHLVNGCLIYALLRKFSLKHRWSLALTLIFAVHPMNVESVAWISATSNLAYTTFYLSALLCYTSQLNNKTKWTVTFFLFVLSCLSKSAAITFPMVLVAYDYVFKKDIKWKEKIPFFAASILFAYVTFLGRESAGHLSELSTKFNWMEQLLIVARNLMYYPIKFLIPIKLSSFYPFPESLNWTYFLSPLAIMGLIIFGLKKPFSKLTWFSIFYYLLNIILVSQIIPFGQQITTDRYLYPVLLSFLLLLYSALKKIDEKYTLSLIGLLAIGLSIQSHQKSKIWESDVLIWEDVLKNFPNVAQAYNNLGSHYFELNQNKKALDYFNRSIDLRKDYADAYSNRGALYGNMNQVQLAVKDLNRAIELKPHADAYFNRGNEWMKLKNTSNAIADYQSSLQLKPTPDAHTNLAFAYLQYGDQNLAMQHLQSALTLNKQYDQAHYLMGMIFWKKGSKKEACKSISQASALGHKKAKQLLSKICS